jgi:TFIIF-interacting CTD phosphatase-like protein
MKQSICFFFRRLQSSCSYFREKQRSIISSEKKIEDLRFLQKKKNRALDQKRAEHLLFQRKTEHISALCPIALLDENVL